MMKRAIPTLLVVATATLALQGCAGVIIGGAAATAVVAQDRRTLGFMIEDQAIEMKANRAIANDPEVAGQAHVRVTSYNGIVLITGEAPDAQTKGKIDTLVRGVTNVRRVHNEVTLAGASSGLSRTSDTYVGTKVKSALFGLEGVEGFSPLHVKVVTENDTVYLMGLLTRAEADAVTQAARQVSGVQRVVKVFEYLD